jgi:hypothetical protein
LKRKSYFVDERALNRAKKALGVKTRQRSFGYPLSVSLKWRSSGN